MGTLLGPFAERFRFCARVNGWDAEEQCLQLQACLHGVAAQILCYGKSGEWTFEGLFNKLEGRFGTEDRADEFLAKLETRKRGANETLQHLYHDIEKLVALSCPGPSSDHTDRYAVWSFLRALDDVTLAEKVRDKQPKTLNEAFKMAQRFESFRVAIAGGKARGGDRERPEKQVRVGMDAVSKDSGNKSGGSRPSVVDQKVFREIQSMKEELNWLKAGAVPGVAVTGVSLPTMGTPAPSQWQQPLRAFPSFVGGPPPPAPTDEGRGYN